MHEARALRLLAMRRAAAAPQPAAVLSWRAQLANLPRPASTRRRFSAALDARRSMPCASCSHKQGWQGREQDRLGEREARGCGR